MAAFPARWEKEAPPWKRDGERFPDRALNTMPLHPARAGLRRTEAQTHICLRMNEMSPALHRTDANPEYGRKPFLAAHMQRSALTQVVRCYGESRVSLFSKTLAKSTKMKAVCKRGISSEISRVFLLKFHRNLYSCRQSCTCAVLALLKECESYKEK